MSIANRYTDFSQPKESVASKQERAVDAFEEVKLASFEEGYQAGWDDGVQARTSERDSVLADLTQCLQDMTFTYHEAYAKLAASMQPLMKEFVNKVLPDAAQRGMPGLVLQEVSNLIETQAEGAIEIVVSQDQFEAFDEVLETKIEMPFTLVADAALGAGHVHVRLGNQEKQIDLDAVRHRIETALDAFFDEITLESTNG